MICPESANFFYGEYGEYGVSRESMSNPGKPGFSFCSIGFEEDGELIFTTQAADEDYLYDEIGAGLLIRKIKDTKQELLQSLSLYYRVMILHEEIDLSED